MAKYDEVEFFQLRDGYYLLSVPLGHITTPVPESNSQINDQERAVLKKLLTIKFENRVPSYVAKALSDAERETLKVLERKGFVNFFKGRKYVDGVYNIPDNAYSLVQRSEKQSPSIQQSYGQSSPPSYHQSSFSSLAGTGSSALLRTKGFLIINSKQEAVALSEQLAQEMKKGLVFGVKGFDNKFYIVSRDYLTSASAKISAALKKDSDLQSIVSATKLDIDGCSAALKIMAENGDIIEKKKGIFAPV
jgi:hypothetical protein